MSQGIKLTEDSINAITLLYKNGVPHKQVAEQLAISPATVSNVISKLGLNRKRK